MSATQALPEESDYVPAQIEFAIQGITNFIKGDPKEVMKAFGKLTNDHDRFFCVTRLEKIDQCLGVEPEYLGKKPSEAHKSRTLGNKYFKEKSYLTAAQAYSRSIVYAPQGGMEDWVVVNNDEVTSGEKQGGDEGKKEGEQEEGEEKEKEEEKYDENELALAYANRSASWFYLNRFRFALMDIDMAFEHDYPKELHFKLYDRKGKCYSKAGKKDLALENFQKAQEALKLSSLEGKNLSKWEKDLQKQIDSCDSIQEKEAKCMKGTGISDVPGISYGHQETFKPFSNAINIEHKTYRGRHLIANQDIRIGDVLMVEKPYVSILMSPHYYNHCYQCYSRPWNPVPCPCCASVIYCSKACQKDSWDTYHRFECRYQTFLNKHWAGRLGHLALRIIMKTGMKKVMQIIEELKDITDEPESKEVGFNTEGVYDDGFRAIFTLSAMTKTRTPEGLCDYAIFSYFLVKLLRHMGWFAEQSRLDDVKYEQPKTLCKLGGALIRIIQILQNNGKGIIEQSAPGDFEKPTPEEIGMGIYCSGALINHSCHANSDLNFFGDNAILRATREIRQGQEVHIEYLGLSFLHMEFSRRTIVIRANFGFKCECEACKDQYPKWQNLDSELPWFICVDCQADLDVTNAQEDENDKEKKYVVCEKCKKKQDVNEAVAALQISHDAYAKGMDMGLSNKSEEALPHLVEHLRVMQRYLSMPWKDMAACQSAIRQCYRLQANVRTNFTDTESW